LIFQSLASSSSGNAYLVSDGQTNILIECGLSHRKLQQACGFKLTSLDAVLISHEHKDHSQCVDKLLASGIPVYLSQGTARALELPENLLDMATEMIAGLQFTVGTMVIKPFSTFHDAQEPMGFVMQSQVDWDVFAFATDTVNLPYNFPGVNILALEANFQQDILDRSERMPEKTKKRVSNTHMEIDKLCQCLRRMDLRSCRELWLLHLSSAMSHEGQFVYKVQRSVPAWVQVKACTK
jgi:phosphoribosyl 1,2-cyclic phosphodiesterase